MALVESGGAVPDFDQGPSGVSAIVRNTVEVATAAAAPALN